MTSTTRTIRRTQWIRFLSRYWLAVFLVLFGIFNLLPFVAPVLMEAGWKSGGNAIYSGYSGLCHQMAQRSFFMFGSETMMNADELPIELSGDMGTDTLRLRQFRGNTDVGWKVAWSDRMVSMYGGVWLAAFAFAIIPRFRKRRPISIFTFVLFILPMAFDGVTHFLSDLGGLTEGFRYHNEWLATLTGNTLSDSFYVGDGLGSFNSWMRLVSGLLFGIGCIGLAFPYMEQYANEAVQYYTSKIDHFKAIQSQSEDFINKLRDQSNTPKATGVESFRNH